MGNLLNQTLGAQFGEVVAERGQRGLRGVDAESFERRGVDIGGVKAFAGGEVGEPYEGMHDRQLPRMIEFETGDALPIGQNGRFGQLPQLAAVDESLENVLLGVVIVVDDGRYALAKLRQVRDILVDTVVSDVVSGRFGSQQTAVTDVLFGETMGVVAANDRIGKIEIFDAGLQFPLVSQYSACEKNTRRQQPACRRSAALKKGVKAASHFCAQRNRSRVVSESARSCSRCGWEQRRKAFLHCWKSIFSWRMRTANQ